MNGRDFPNWKVIAVRLSSPLTASTLGLVSCKLSHLPGWMGLGGAVESFLILGTFSSPQLTLSGLVTVMVSIVTCGAPILPTAGSLKQKIL